MEAVASSKDGSDEGPFAGWTGLGTVPAEVVGIHRGTYAACVHIVPLVVGYS